MVKILSNGDIVPDDDPRASQSPRGSSARPRPRQGYVQHDDAQQQQYVGGQLSVFDTANQKLLNMGIPRWNAGPYTVEPIVSVGFVLAGLMFGLQGLMFAAILFLVSKWSQGGGGFGNMFGGQAQGGGQAPGGGGGGGGGWGGGHRLGR